MTWRLHPALADATVLWRHLADALVPVERGSAADTSVVLLVHAATSEDEADIGTIARALTDLGWSHRDGSPVSRGEVLGVWNDLWTVVGNVGERVGDRRSGRTLSTSARLLVHDALFAEVETEQSS